MLSSWKADKILLSRRVRCPPRASPTRTVGLRVPLARASRRYEYGILP